MSCFQMALLVALRSAFRTQGLFTSLLLAACLLVGSTASVSGQEVMTNETVIQMVKAGFSENVILAKMRSSQTKFDTRTEALIALKQAGGSEKVMSAIISGGGPPASAPAAPAPGASAPAAVATAPPGSHPRPVHHVSRGQQGELRGVSRRPRTRPAPLSGRTTE